MCRMQISLGTLFGFLLALPLGFASPILDKKDISTRPQNSGKHPLNNLNESSSNPLGFEDIVQLRLEDLHETWPHAEMIAAKGLSAPGSSRKSWSYTTIFLKLYDPSSDTEISTSTVRRTGTPPQWTDPTSRDARAGTERLAWEWGDDDLSLERAFHLVDVYLGEQKQWQEIWKGKFKSLPSRFRDQVYYLLSARPGLPGRMMVGIEDEQVYERTRRDSDESNDSVDADDGGAIDDIQDAEWVHIGPVATSAATS